MTKPVNYEFFDPKLHTFDEEGKYKVRENVPPGTVAISAADLHFLNFHNDNPAVYQTLVRLARQAVARGHKRVGMKMLWEVMRWEHLLNEPVDRQGSTYRFDNNLHSRYARMIMAHEPDLAGIFETRRLTT